MEKNRSLPQRFFDLYKDPNNLSALQNQFVATRDYQAKAQNLLQQYSDALNEYLSICSVARCPPVLNYPFRFFYRDEKHHVYTIYYYPYASQRKSNRLTEDGFPYLLSCIFDSSVLQSANISFPTKGKTVDQLYSALYNLISTYPYDRLSLIIDGLKKYNLKIAFKFLKHSAFRCSSEGNIYINTQYRDLYDDKTFTYFFPSILEPDYISELITASEQYIPLRLIKSCFYELLKKSKKDPSLVHQIIIKEPCPNKALFSQPTLYIHQRRWQAIQYSQDGDCFQYCTLQDSYEVLGYQPKVIPLPIDTTSDFSKAILPFFSNILNGDLLLLDQFISALTDSMQTDGSKFLVLHTKEHKKELQAFFSDVLSHTAAKIDFQPHPKARQRTCLTLTQITKPKYLRSLFLAQSTGKCTILVDDVYPSDRSRATLKKLIAGKRIAIESDFAPPQHYHNRLCIVCVTDDQRKAEYFKKFFKAKVIDFSHAESSTPYDLKFEPQDISWFYNTLIPYGLKLKTLQENSIADPHPFTYPHTPSPPSEEECIESFLKLCHNQKDCLCTTSEVYDSYREFLAVTQAGRISSMTKVMFNKKFKEFTKSRFVFKRPHKSRTGPSPYCYVGLKLPETFPSPVIPTYGAAQESFLQQYLEHISQYRIKYQGLRIKVSVTTEE